MLEKTRIILGLCQETRTMDYVVFDIDESDTSYDPEDRGSYAVQSLALNSEHWIDMGSPEFITVTVEPGDKLNTEGEDDGKRD